MKKYLIGLFAIILVGNSMAQSKSKTKVAIEKIMQEQIVAWNNGDIKGFMYAYWNNDSLRFVGQSGITYGWNQTFENYKKAYPDKTAMGELDFEIIKIDELSKQSCYVIGRWRLKRQKDSLGGYFTLLWKNINNKWVIVVDHTS